MILNNHLPKRVNLHSTQMSQGVEQVDQSAKLPFNDNFHPFDVRKAFKRGLRLEQLQESQKWIQDKITELENDLSTTVQALIDRNTELQWRVDPFSNDGESLADYYNAE